MIARKENQLFFWCHEAGVEDPVVLVEGDGATVNKLLIAGDDVT